VDTPVDRDPKNQPSLVWLSSVLPYDELPTKTDELTDLKGVVSSSAGLFGGRRSSNRRCATASYTTASVRQRPRTISPLFSVPRCRVNCHRARRFSGDGDPTVGPKTRGGLEPNAPSQTAVRNCVPRPCETSMKRRDRGGTVQGAPVENLHSPSKSTKGAESLGPFGFRYFLWLRGPAITDIKRPQIRGGLDLASSRPSNPCPNAAARRSSAEAHAGPAGHPGGLGAVSRRNAFAVT